MSEVSMIAVRALAAAVEDAGATRERFLSEAWLSAEQLADEHGRISRAEYNRAQRAALKVSGDPGLGLHMAGQAGRGRYDFLTTLVEHCSSLREALACSARYARVVMEGPRLQVTERDEIATIRVGPLGEDSPEVRRTAEFVASSLTYLVRRFVGGEALPRQVLFPYAPPAHRAEYTRIFAGRERFSQEHTGIEIERSWLDRAQFYRSEELRLLLEERAELLLARVEHEAVASQRVRRWLASQNLRPRPTMDSIARDLGMSGRSLRRRLREERVLYPALLDEARVTRAKHMLMDPRRSLQETAYALGFDTQAAFARAFKRWTGASPSVYRAER
jgi:AraC-like DNA-binding protein